jgi:hypothetical protein
MHPEKDNLNLYPYAATWNFEASNSGLPSYNVDANIYSGNN